MLAGNACSASAKGCAVFYLVVQNQNTLTQLSTAFSLVLLQPYSLSFASQLNLALAITTTTNSIDLNSLRDLTIL